MTNIEFALFGLIPAQPMSKLSIITSEVFMIRIPTDRPPTHPGEMLLEEFLQPMEITQRELATAIQVPYQRINEIINQRRGMTPSTALRLEKYFGVSAAFWLNLQMRWDLYQAIRSEPLNQIQPRIAG
jgi:antitoxin HigA-1